MTRPLIQINITQWQKTQAKLAKFAEDLQPEVSKAFGEAALKVVKFYPPYKLVSRKKAYPPSGWQSDKQRRYVMARIRSGSIEPGYPHRTGKIQRGWKFDGKSISNNEPGAQWIMGDKKQANQPRLVGWKKATALIREKWSEIIDSVDKSVADLIKKSGLS